MTPSAPRETVVSPTVCKSLGLNALLDTVQDDRTYSILDLGPALEDNVQFWSQFSCWLHIQDFYRSYQEWKAAPKPEEECEEAAFSVLLPFSDETVFDIILVWDLFNYFDLRELAVLVQRLSRWCRPGTRLFALISILPTISVSPTMFRILNREQMIHEIPTQETRPSPRHQPRDIVRLMAQFTVSCSFLLRHGIQEYVFVFK
ncbi:hypothetical protein AMJ44_01610 [candidate division WOR-1 bacterium DG_54_3]|uniref:Methyltransferase type 11 domain-containing protein n=1 Tax=candidate division WOR-1 bacterium DG_54_3 TaxID=1703775 RepID=A0A0S7Y5J2_UNCSA|nr:MAG: hypothetical protein AMJ44_01610 [candidate division WOR-1 bacterium DG_54_3]